jgi:flavin reductase (DIM6/NTAB) family NADH-FMN oxidoreductase RutF
MVAFDARRITDIVEKGTHLVVFGEIAGDPARRASTMHGLLYFARDYRRVGVAA